MSHYLIVFILFNIVIIFTVFGTTYPAKVVSREFALRAETTSYHQSERSINISPMVESMAVSKTIAMHVLTKEM